MAELNFGVGDFVRLRLADRELDGRVLESSDAGIILLKLESGYNIGISRENILAGRVLRKFSENKKVFEVERKTNLPTIGMVVTGGTIASKLDARTGGVKPISDVDEFASLYPELFGMVNVKKIEMPFSMLSENMSSEQWKIIARCVKELLDDSEIQGVIVTHGTDTLHYTSVALSFFLRNLNKPVVLTYSQKSIDRASSDAHLNLLCAARMAISDYAEVMIVGHATTNDDFCYAMRGTKVRKMHTSRRDAFKSVNEEIIARVFPDKVEFISSYEKKDSRKKMELDMEFSDKIALVKFYPGQDPSILDYYALKYKGIILEGTGIGHVAASGAQNSWLAKIRKHIRDGMIVCMTSQCLFGRVDGYVYETGRELLDAGVIYLEDMLPETAFVKLGWVLGHYGWKKNVNEKMLENVAGELNERLRVAI